MSLGEMKISLDHSLDPGTRLCMAAATGDLEIGSTILIKEYLKSLSSSYLEAYRIGMGCSLNIQDCKGWTLLHHAAMTGQVETLRFVIAHGDINVNYMSSDGWTPVQLAVRSSGLHRIECFEILVKNGADVIDVNTPLKSLIYVLGSIKRDMANEQIAIVILNKFRETIQQENTITHDFCQQAELALNKARELAQLSGKFMIEGQLLNEINNVRNLQHRIQVQVHLHAALQRQNS